MNNPIEQIHEMNELSDAIEKIRHLDEQIRQPDRDGMIKALSEAQSIAFTEIAITQIQQGAKYKLWKDFTDEEQYAFALQTGTMSALYNQVWRKSGKRAFRFNKTTVIAEGAKNVFVFERQSELDYSIVHNNCFFYRHYRFFRFELSDSQATKRTAK